MTAPPQRKKRAGRTGYVERLPNLIEWLDTISTTCGACAGHRTVWCPECAGFMGCETCSHTYKVACPQCAGGKREGWRPW